MAGTLTDRERARLRRRLETEGWRAAARRLSVSYNTLRRAVEGAEPVQTGTLTLLRNELSGSP